MQVADDMAKKMGETCLQLVAISIKGGSVREASALKLQKAMDIPQSWKLRETSMLMAW